MDIIKLLAVFIVIAIVMKLNKPLYLSISAGSIAAILLFGLSASGALSSIRIGIFGKSTITLILAFYSITFLQRMLEKRGHIMLAEESLSKIFNSRRINAMIAPFAIGLLPSPGAVLIAAPIVDKAAEGYLDLEERTFVTSYYRHISEAFLPTYASILLALNLSGVDMGLFVAGMLPLVFVMFFLGYIIYIRKIPKAEKSPTIIDKTEAVKDLVRSLWTIVTTITVILMFKLPVHVGVIPVILLSIFINKFNFKEIKPMFYTALEKKLVLTTIAVMVFKEILTYTGIIERLPGYFSILPIPAVAVFGLIFFFGTLVAGAQAMIALALPLSFATIPDGGLALLVFLMSISYISMQISPTHICLAIITDHNKTSFGSLVAKTMPVLIPFVIISSIYSYILYSLV